MSDFRVMAEAATTAACEKLGRRDSCRTHRETLSGEPLGEAPSYPRPWRPVKRFLRHHPRLRELHALGYLGLAFARHLARRALSGNSLAQTEQLRAYYGL